MKHASDIMLVLRRVLININLRHEIKITTEQKNYTVQIF